jgi:DNA-binding CsgD family transcriptional regulator
VFLAIDFNVIHLLEDSSVNGFVLEGTNVTDELLLQKNETDSLVTKLDEKEQVIFQVNKEVAFSNLKLDLSRQTFEELRVKMEYQPKESRMKELKELVQHGLQSGKYWDNFLKHFDIANQQFFKRLNEKHPDLTINEEKHCAFLKIKLTNKEVASILGVAPDTVKKARQRLKKKLELALDDSLKSYIEQF